MVGWLRPVLGFSLSQAEQKYSPSWGMGTHKLMPGKPGKGSKLSLQNFLILSPSNYSSHTISELKEKPPHFVELQHYFSNVKLLILKLIEAGI